MTPLSTRLHELATHFADEVLAAIRATSLHELTSDVQTTGRRRPEMPALAGSAPAPSSAPAKKSPKIVNGRLARRSSDDVEATLRLVVAALKVGPMNGEAIRKSLGLERQELPRVLALGLKSKRIKKKGNRRGTIYSAT